MGSICPICNKEEFEGTLFCSDCGTKMFMENDAFAKFSNPININTDSLHSQKKSVGFLNEQLNEDQVNLRIIKTGQILPLAGEGEYIIGRVGKGQSVLPDIDLTAFEAYSLGVSRLHAIISIQEKGINLVDLSSSNGTKVNNKKISPQIEHPIKNGDEIIFGKLKIQALLHQEKYIF